MAEVSNEPSMEEILSSIKRIIAEEGDVAQANRKARRPRAEPVLSDAAGGVEGPEAPPAAAPEEVLELTDAVPAEEEVRPVTPTTEKDAPKTATVSVKPPAPPAAEQPPATLVSPTAASASRDALANLSMMVVKPDAPGNTLEGLVREMLKPMLKDWLDAHLPDIVERLVSKEIKRISERD